ncbi:MAG: glycogen debranching enzyme N-terminal domain-containing protein [Candidatus Kryptoniota bacterium]
MITYTEKQLRDLTFSSTKEWLMTDSDGGFSSSTVSFMNMRRQHSLLTVSVNQPLKRMTLLNKIDEEVIIDGKSYFLGSNQYPGTTFPEGYKLLNKFTFDYFPQVTFGLEGCQLSKKLLMPKRSSSVFLHYENQSKKEMTLRLLPLLSFRLKDSLRKAGDGFLVDELPDGVRIIAEMNLPKLYLKLSQMYNTTPESRWYFNFIYSHDADIYEDDKEDLYNIGYWETELEPGKGVTLAASTRDLGEFDYGEIERRYIEYIDQIRASSHLSKKYFHLADIAANHIVKSRAIRSEAIMVGYPYGSITVRETLLSLDGISNVADDAYDMPHSTNEIIERHKIGEPTHGTNYERDFLYDLIANKMSGAFPSGIDEETLHINYDDPQIPLYFVMALARFAVKDTGKSIMVRYLPIMEEAIDVITQNCLGGTMSADSSLLIVDGTSRDDLSKIALNASVNALWYNLLKLVDDTKSSMVTDSSQPRPPSAHSATAAKISETYFETFFNDDGSYKNSDGKNNVTSEMVMPLIVHNSPLDEEQRSKVCKILVAKFLDSFGNHSAHNSPHHACNLAAIYLTEASSQMKDCERELGSMKWYIKKLLSLEEFTNCVDGLPKCGNVGFGRNLQDISSAVVAGEAIRLVKKLQMK